MVPNRTKHHICSKLTTTRATSSMISNILLDLYAHITYTYVTYTWNLLWLILLTQCSVSIPLENIRKSSVFLIFSGSIEQNIGLKWINQFDKKLTNFYVTTTMKVMTLKLLTFSLPYISASCMEIKIKLNFVFTFLPLRPS